MQQPIRRRGRLFALLLFYILFAKAEAELRRGIEINYSGPRALEDTAAVAAVDAYGNLYAAGWTTVGINVEALLVRRTPAGAQWVQTVGGTTTNDYFVDMELDYVGNAYCVGFLRTASNQDDVLLAKISPSGTVLWTRSWSAGATSIDRAVGVAIDAVGNAYVAVSTSTNGNFNWGLLKWDPTGSLLWSRFVGGSRTDIPFDILLDRTDSPLMAGSIINETGVGDTEAGIARWSPSGNFEWSDAYESPGDREDRAVKLALDIETGRVAMAVNGVHDGRGAGILREYTSSGTVDSWHLESDAGGGTIRLNSVAYGPDNRPTAVGARYVDAVLREQFYVMDTDWAFVVRRSFGGSLVNDVANDIAVSSSGETVVVGRLGDPPNSKAHIVVEPTKDHKTWTITSPADGDNAALSARANLFGSVAIAGHQSAAGSGRNAWALALNEQVDRADVDRSGCVDDADLTDLILEFGNSRRIATIGADGNVRFWSQATGELLNTKAIPGFGQGIIRYSPDEIRYLTATQDPAFDVFGTFFNNGIFRRSLFQPVIDIAYSPNYDFIITLDSGGFRRFNSGGLELGVVPIPVGGRKLAFSPDRKSMAIAMDNGAVRVYNLYSDTLIYTMLPLHGANPSIAWSPKNDRIATGGADGRVRMTMFDGNQIGNTLVSVGEIRSMAFSADGSLLAVGGSNGKIALVAADGSFLANMPSHNGAVTSLMFNASGETLYSGGADGILRASSVSARATVWTKQAHSAGSVMLDRLTPSREDVNQDGIVDDADLTELILRFGEGCN